MSKIIKFTGFNSIPNDEVYRLLIQDYNKDTRFINIIEGEDTIISESDLSNIPKKLFEDGIFVIVGSINDDENYVEIVESLPEATRQQRGRIIIVENEDDSLMDKIYVCKRLNDGNYQWIEI
ncbi:hypothetical protein D3C87_77360 [compost metagenome]